MGFAGLRVLSLESRRAKEMETLILRQDGVPFIAPSVKEHALDDLSIALQFVEQLEAGRFEMLVCMTGVGLALLRDVLTRIMPVERLSAALQKTIIVSRGPKPVSILRELNAPAHVVIPEPNTWKEVVDAVALRPERKIAIQEYGRPNPELTAALEAIGATVTPIAIYRWELPDDTRSLRRVALGLARAISTWPCSPLPFNSITCSK